MYRPAEGKLERLNQKLADRELYVGEFYYRTNLYNAAITRLEYLLKKYPKANGLDKALYYISMSYKALGDPVKSDEYSEKLRNEYPNSTVHKPSNIKGEANPKVSKNGTSSYESEFIKQKGN